MRWEQRLAFFMGEAARPFAIIATSASAAGATVLIALRVTSYAEGAAFIAAVFVGVGALYGAKAWENARNRRAEAEVDIARATGRRSTDPQPVEVVNPPSDPVQTEEAR